MSCRRLKVKTDREVFKALWDWLAKNPGKFKFQWPDWDLYGGKDRYKNHNLCPACSTAGVRNPGAASICKFCPLMKAAEALRPESADPRCLRALYVEYVDSFHDPERRAKPAAQIRDLEWED